MGVIFISKTEREYINARRFKDDRFKDLENMIYLDIDKPYFIKPETHPILYRLSASKKGFHLAFKREWLTDREMFLLLRQCDHNWLCLCITDGYFRIAKNKNGREATEWRMTLQVNKMNKLQSHTKKLLDLINQYPKIDVKVIDFEKIKAKLTRQDEYNLAEFEESPSKTTNLIKKPKNIIEMVENIHCQK